MWNWFLDLILKFYGAIYSFFGLEVLTGANANWLDNFRGGNAFTTVVVWVAVMNVVYYIHKHKTSHRHKGKLKQLEESNTAFKIIAITIRQIIYLTIIFNIVCLFGVFIYWGFLFWRYTDEKMSIWTAPSGSTSKNYERGRAAGRHDSRYRK